MSTGSQMVLKFSKKGIRGQREVGVRAGRLDEHSPVQRAKLAEVLVFSVSAPSPSPSHYQSTAKTTKTRVNHVLLPYKGLTSCSGLTPHSPTLCLVYDRSRGSPPTVTLLLLNVQCWAWGILF